MKEHAALIYEEIMRDMSDGVMMIGLDGIIDFVNPAAANILQMPVSKLAGRRFASCFFEYAENDAFNQTILDAVYDSGTMHDRIVPYYTGSQIRQLHMRTSYLRSGEEKVGVIAVLNDISELSELRDAVKAMQRIQALNHQLELRNQLLSETFGRYLSDKIVRQLLETPDGLALGGKKETLTVMMSDLRGFTAMSERMEASALLNMLNHYLGEMTEIIQKRNGTIIEFIGDGIMAIFGAPAHSKTHADDAAATAIEMQNRMKDINAWNAQRGYPKLEMGIGLNTGEMIVGNIGSQKRTKYGVVGSQVNLCGRVESYTVGGQILISPATRNAISAALDVEKEMEVMPKGMKTSMVLSQIRGIGEPYAVSHVEEENFPQPLKKEAEIVFRMLRGKHCEQGAIHGVFCALNQTGAVLKTEYALHELDDIRIEAQGDLFAKVLRRAEDGWLLRFTSLPAGFDAWMKSIREKADD